MLGHPGPLLAGPQGPGADAGVSPNGGSPWVALIDDPAQPPPGASLYLLERATDAVTIAELRRELRSAPLATLAEAEDPLRPSDADVLVTVVPSDPEQAAWSALAAGIRAGGRPLVALVREPVSADCVTAAIDAGAAGAVFASGERDLDAELLQAVAAGERTRLARAPLITVAICNRDGSGDLQRCLRSLHGVDYPSFEALVIDDGSRDDSVAVARGFGARVVEMPASGLGYARNAAIEHARGEIIAFLDGDAEAEPQWLARLWRLHDRLAPGGVGGPNLGMPDAGWQERAIGGAPGVAMPIVRADGRATHLAGCNMSFRTDVARAAMFDPDAPSGDDIRFCYRVIDLGEDLLLHPTATVRHHRRRSIRGYLRQMSIYGLWSTLMNVEHGQRLVDVDTQPGLLARLDPRRPHVCFRGPQAAQRYALAFAPLSNGFPLKALAATLAGGVAASPLAWMLGRLRPWAGLTGAAAAAQVGYVIARTPVQDGPRGLPALVNRLLTAGLWYAGPAAVALGRLRGLRQARGGGSGER